MSRPIRLVRQTAQSIHWGESCPLCGSAHAAYVFGAGDYRVHRCAGCALTSGRTAPNAHLRERQPARADHRSRGIEQHHPALIGALEPLAVRGPALVFAADDDSVVGAVAGCGARLTHIADHEQLTGLKSQDRFDTAVISDALMRSADPVATLVKIRQHLNDGARLLLSMPLVDGRQARFLGRNWHEWRAENRWYFSRETLHLLLLRAGFDQVWFEAERRRYNLERLAQRMKESGRTTAVSRALDSVQAMSPKGLRRLEFRLPYGTSVISATAAVAATGPATLSIIVPVFNERATVQTALEALVAKELPGMGKEIIVVESNSTDGSRELVQEYRDRPGVKLLLQPQPRGKGHAVREGLAAATGAIVMIQDADLEYDLDDYDGLLEPLIAWQTMFVLGSRHTGSWKMRQFNDAPVTAAIFNFGHWFFQTLMNRVLRTRMSDPFTMFKLFRRDALSGVDLVCNRFDLDIELVIKLVRRGYVPLELPVNYTARSFAEGKKVSFVRDGLTWVWTILKLRFSPIGSGPA